MVWYTRFYAMHRGVNPVYFWCDNPNASTCIDCRSSSSDCHACATVADLRSVNGTIVIHDIIVVSGRICAREVDANVADHINGAYLKPNPDEWIDRPFTYFAQMLEKDACGASRPCVLPHMMIAREDDDWVGVKHWAYKWITSYLEVCVTCPPYKLCCAGIAIVYSHTASPYVEVDDRTDIDAIIAALRRNGIRAGFVRYTARDRNIARIILASPSDVERARKAIESMGIEVLGYGYE